MVAVTRNEHTTPRIDGSPAPEARTEPVLLASGIEKSYRHGIWPVRRTHQVLRSADLTLRPREVVGLVGENGSGKSTLLKVLVGALRPDAGTVTVAGTLGYCPQEPIGYERLTCRGCSAWAGCSRSGCSPPDCSARPRQ